MSLPELRHCGLRLYRLLLKLHGSLDPNFATLGNKFVRNEFKQHHYPKIPDFTTGHYILFMKEWTNYLISMSEPDTRLYGRAIDPATLGKLNSKQKESLRQLKLEIYGREDD